jgi:signal transduction histidine kinase/ABC-type amino acid transport substrate-binding protein
LVLTLSTTSLAAQEEKADSVKVFTDEHPLVYEDAWDLWPYAFLNDAGEPVGFNIDLLKLICKELNIPYRVKLKPTKEALEDLKAGRADIMCGMDAHFHNEYGQYGKAVIQIFTHSIVHKKDDPTFIKTIDDLARHRVIVHGGSFSHHLMIQNGWGNNAIPYDDMQEAVQYVHRVEDSQIVWNTLSLKWLLRKFQYDDLELSPVNIPHGEYKFMSNNPQLLEQFDKAFAFLNSTGRLQPIQNKWFYPERKETGLPSWIWRLVIAMLIIIVAFLIYYAAFRIYEKRMTKDVRQSNSRLSLILNTSKVHIWLFNIAERTVSRLDNKGNKETIPLSPNFFQYYMIPEDYEMLCSVLQQFARQEKEKDTLEVRCTRGHNEGIFTFSVNLSVLRRGRNGRPSVIIGATTNVTNERLRLQKQKDAMLRYQAIFSSAMVDTVSYDEHGIIDNMNEKASRAIPGGVEKVIASRVPIQKVLGDDSITEDNMEYTYLTQIYKSPDDERPLNRFLKRDELYYELQLVPVRDDNGKLLAIYGTGRDVTEVAKSYSHLQKNIVELEKANEELQDYVRNIDYVMQYGGVRMATYSPDTHTLTVYSEINHVQLQLTQTRLLTLADDESKKTAQRLLKTMDNRSNTTVKDSVKSTLRTKGGRRLCLYFSFVPTLDEKGHVKEYFGMVRDISEIKATEEQLSRETVKAQEVETLKNAFLRNMSYEIRTPLNAVVGFAELFEQEHSEDDERLFIRQIKDSSEKLLKLINDILYLSRLDAGMIEFNKKPIDFAGVFESRCRAAWRSYQQPDVSFVVDNAYERLVLDVDVQNLGIVIDQIAINAAQHTKSGYVRARYDYNGEELTVAFQDTGSGIPASKVKGIFGRFFTTDGVGSGLGLAICHEVVEHLGGKIRIKSEVGKGTIVWVSIPCKFIEIIRK